MKHTGSHITLRHDLAALPFLVPFFAVFLVFIAYPIIYSLWLSVHQVTIFSDFYDTFGTMTYVGLENYARILTSVQFWWAVAATFIYAVLTIVPGIALSLFLALMLNRALMGFGLMRSGFFLPHVFDIYVVGIVWLLLYYPGSGLVSQFIATLGAAETARDGVLDNPYLTLPAITAAMVLKNAGFGMILFLVTLNNINPSIMEAADVDGAGKGQKLLYVTLPLLRPIILFLVVTGTVGAINAFAEIYAMTDDTGGVPVEMAGETVQSARTGGYHLFKTFDEGRYGEAAAVSFVFMLFALVISYVNFRLLRSSD